MTAETLKARRLYLVKKLSSWMLEEIVALAELTSFSLVLLRTPEAQYRDGLEQVRNLGVQVLVKPFSMKGIGRRFFSALFFCLGHGRKMLGGYNAVIGWKAVYWFLRLNPDFFLKPFQIHAQFATQAALLALLLCRGRPGCSFCFTVHAHDIFFPNRWLGLLAGAAEKVFCISEFNIVYLRREYGLAGSDKLFLARLGVRPPEGVLTVNREKDELVIGFMSRLIAKKGLPDLLAAFKVLTTEIPVRLLIAGDGPEAGRLKGLDNDRISYLGRISGPEKEVFFARLDVFVLPARPAGHDLDGIPVVLMEAADRGLPLVSTRVSGIPEICVDQYNGLLVPPGDTAALAAALLKLGRDDDLRRRLGENSRQIAGQYDLVANTRVKAELLGWLEEET